MSSENILSKFNPNASFPIKEYITYRSTLKTYEAFGKETEEKQKGEKIDVDSNLMKVALDFKAKYNETVEEVKTKLITTFFVNIGEMEILENYDLLWDHILKEKPSIVDFFYLPKTKTKNVENSSETTPTEK